MKMRIGSRGSPLARGQANWVMTELQKKNPQLDLSLTIIKTTGDKDPHSALTKMGGKGVFVKEIEEALLAKRIDLAVHSLKDVPQMLPSGLQMGPYPRRETPNDALISRFGELLRELPRGSIVGTSSPRRISQIFFHYKDRYRIEPIRGNVETRIQKLRKGEYDAILMACAGLKRLGLESEITEVIDVHQMIPAPGQGCLGLEYREENEEMSAILDTISDKESDITARAERSFLQGMGGSCLIPLGGLARIEGNELILKAVILTPNGEKRVEIEEKGDPSEPEFLGGQVAERLLHEGGSDILLKIQ
ncbi:hydroxymethylbilane synthase [bacterium F11]|nr:hydroxymethylbilane synthase [bacterium F11]